MKNVFNVMKMKGYSRKGRSCYKRVNSMVFAVGFEPFKFNPIKDMVENYNRSKSFVIKMEVLYPVGAGEWISIQPYAFTNLRRNGQARWVEFNFEIEGIFFQEEEALVCGLLEQHLDGWERVLTDPETALKMLLWLRNLADLPPEFSYFKNYTQHTKDDYKKFYLSGEASIFRQDSRHLQICSGAYFNLAGAFNLTLTTLPHSDNTQANDKIITDALNQHIELNVDDLQPFGLKL